MAERMAVCYQWNRFFLQGTRMRSTFPEFFVGESERQEKLWADCIFVFDTNVLLDLYRFSDSAREALFKVMESLGERLWIPYQVAIEYFDNRLGVIEAQSEAYSKSISGLRIAKDKFNAGTRHPFVSDTVFDKFISSYEQMIEELEGKQKSYMSFVSDDLIKRRIGNLLEGCVGTPYSGERLLEIAAEGELRYAENIPPGFEDGGKMPEATTTKLRLKKFGDLILWKQIIDKALAVDKAVVLVTGEKKDDWWLKSDKRLVSALPALSQEFMGAVKRDFYLYATDRFLVKANEYLKQDTSENVVEEVRAVSKAEAERKDVADDVLLDHALNEIWPHASGTEKWWSPKKTLKGKDFESMRSPHFHMLQEQRFLLQERAHEVQKNLESFIRDHKELKAVRDQFLLSGVSPDDARTVAINQRISTLSELIESYEQDLSLLRNQMREVVDLQHSIMNEKKHV